MKKSQLKQIIQEEVQKLLKEEEAVHNLSGLEDSSDSPLDQIGFKSVNEEGVDSQYVVQDKEGSHINPEAVKNYLMKYVDRPDIQGEPIGIKGIETFINDDDGFGEAQMYFILGTSDPVGKNYITPIKDEEIEKYFTQELSYYLFSKPNELGYEDGDNDLWDYGDMDPASGYGPTSHI